MTEEIGRQIELRGHVGAGGGYDQSADVRDQSRGPAIDQLSNFRQAAVKPVERHRGKRDQLVLRQGQRSTKGGVIAVANVVEGNQGVVGVVAAIKEDADERLIARRRSLSKSIQRAEGAEPDKTAARGQRGVLDKLRRLILMLVLLLLVDLVEIGTDDKPSGYTDALADICQKRRHWPQWPIASPSSFGRG